MILFAFAGNMDVEMFAKTVPSARKISNARLPGYNFIFNKTADDQSSKANIIQSSNPNDSVWGVLIELNDNERGYFFNKDSWSSDFKLEPVTCMDKDDNIYMAEAFVAEPHAVNTHLLPYDWYIQKIIRLAELAGLPEDYIKRLSLVPYKVDPDDERREKRLGKIK